MFVLCFVWIFSYLPQKVTQNVERSQVRGIGFDATCSLVVLDQNFQPVPVCHDGELNINSLQNFDFHLKLTHLFARMTYILLSGQTSWFGFFICLLFFLNLVLFIVLCVLRPAIMEKQNEIKTVQKKKERKNERNKPRGLIWQRY